VLERGIIRYLYKRPMDTLLAGLSGVSLVLMQGVCLWFGSDPKILADHRSTQAISSWLRQYFGFQSDSAGHHHRAWSWPCGRCSTYPFRRSVVPHEGTKEMAAAFGINSIESTC